MQENASTVISLPLQHLLGHTQIKTTQRYSHLTQDTLLDASNAVTRAVGHLFVPMVSASPAKQVQLVQRADTPNLRPVALSTAVSVLIVGLPREDRVR